MKFCEGNDNSILRNRLKQAIYEGNISHAYLFEGPSNMNKIAFANDFVKGVLCPDKRGDNCGKCNICDKIEHGNHEDIVYIEKDGLSVKDSSVEKVQEKLSVKPLGERNIVIISDCDTMTSRAQNRLLKTLEEPPGNAVIILLSENMENLTQTVLSRCVKFRLEGDVNSGNDTKAERLIKMALEGGKFYELADEVKGYSKDKEKTVILLDSMEQVYRKMITDNYLNVPLYKFDDIYDSIKYIEEARKHMKQGMSVGNALKMLLIKIS